ncbi:LysR family transcriptional regulator [Leptospira sp. severe_002]|uniref:LysR family transcriptional regulator n=1 Tax=Leptospira sp. severe_002 TaxID=2838237 RepID=UPI001E4CC5A8|nr:LysR family transcriptional regulator [Leptospira sp. severe_002]
MNIRHLRYFVALARERNHARAASSCNVTQPTLSEAVRQLEHELAVPLIDRKGPRFQGLTPEGERVLVWAQRILADEDALGQELSEMREGLSGSLRFGVIPAAMPVTPLITNPFLTMHPLVTLKILSHTSIEIQRGLDDGTLEAGLTYLDNEPLKNVRLLPLYRERYMLLTPSGGPFDGRLGVSWREAARLPLCLLTRDMQNRRIVERLFNEGGAAAPKVALETNSVLALVAHVSSGRWSSVIPHTFLRVLGGRPEAKAGFVAIPLLEPESAQTVGLVLNERDPLPPLARALLKSARDNDLSKELDSDLLPLH